MQPAAMQAFAVASFSDERRCGRGFNDPTSLQVLRTMKPSKDQSPSWHAWDQSAFRRQQQDASGMSCQPGC